MRARLAPEGPALARLRPFARRMVCLLVTGHTRAEIAARFNKKKHTSDTMIMRAMEQLDAKSDVELVLVAFGLAAVKRKPG